MAAYSDMSEALAALECKLKTLQSVTEANQFLVGAMRDHGDELSEMSEAETRSAMLNWAQAEFGEGAKHEDEAVLEILETSFATRRSAEIIPFPKRG